MNIVSFIRQTCIHYPEKSAFENRQMVLSYRQLYGKINGAACILENRGVRAGDRVLLVLDNCPDFLFYFFAIIKIGAIAVPLKHEYKSWEFSMFYGNCRPKLLVTSHSWIDENGWVTHYVKKAKALVVVDELELGTTEPDTGIYAARNRDPATINYSCFGNGYPRGAILSHGNHFYAAVGCCRKLQYSPSDRFLVILPVSSIFGLVSSIYAPLITAGTIVMTGNFLPKSILADLEEYRITFLNCVPSTLDYLLPVYQACKQDLSCLRLIVSGGDHLAAGLQRRLSDLFQTTIVQGYGLTECMPLICNPQDERNKPGSLGIPNRRDIQVKVADENGNSLPAAAIGEILIRGPTVMSGYYNLPGETEKIIKGGWLYTGDLGFLDKEGFLYFTGLKKEIFNLHGNKIDPVEVKRSLLENPHIQDVKLFLEEEEGRSLLNTKKLCADVFLKDSGNALTARDIRNYCREKMAGYKVPQKINIHIDKLQL